jgi:hypothetical protein
MSGHSRKERVPEPAVCERHRAGLNFSASARQAATRDQFKAFLKLFYEAVGLGKVVTLIGSRS